MHSFSPVAGLLQTLHGQLAPLLAVLDVIASLIRLENRPVAERVRAGMGRAREAGRRVGRPVADLVPGRLGELRSKGLSLRAIGRIVGVSHATVAKALRSAQ